MVSKMACMLSLLLVICVDIFVKKKKKITTLCGAVMAAASPWSSPTAGTQ